MNSPQDRREREAALHRQLATEYEIRYGRPFARCYQRYWNELLLEMLPPATHSVLDAGCGSGILLEELVERYREVVGLDLSPEMLSRIPPDVAARSQLVCAPLETVELAPHHFDAVICRGMLHHLPDLDASLARLRGLLRPGGCLIASEPCADSWLLRAPRWFWRTFSGRFDRDHLAFRSRQLRRSLENAGFQVVAQRKFGFVAFPLCSLSDILPVLRHTPGSVTITRGLIVLDELLARLPLVRNESWHVIVRADAVAQDGSR